MAVVGATGAVGQEMLAVLEQREFPVDQLDLLASSNSAGRTMRFRGRDLVVQALGDDSFDGVDLALFSAGCVDLAPAGAARGRARGGRGRQQLGLPPRPRGAAGDPRVQRAGPGAASGHHRQSQLLDHLDGDGDVPVALRRGRAEGRGLHVPGGVGRRAAGDGGAGPGDPGASGGSGVRARGDAAPLAFNVFPHIDAFLADGYTREEDKMLHETRKIVGAPDLPVEATCVRVPVHRCHAISLTLATERQISPEEARQALASAPGLVVVDDPEQALVPQPIDLAGEDRVAVGRIRRSRAFDPGLALWVVGDQLRKGAALNAVQIAENL